MRYVLGRSADYDRHLRLLVDFLVAARTLGRDPVLGVHDSAALAAVALVTPPGDRDPPEALYARRETLWATLGAGARERYERFGVASRRLVVEAPHHHLNMIGVRRTRTGRGLGRLLLDAVHALALADPDSAGVTLTTERQENVGLYQHFGYRLLGLTEVAAGLETWSLFRDGRGSSAPPP